MQIDDATRSTFRPPRAGNAYEGPDGVDKRSSPHGMRGFTDKLRDGLRPALWIGGFLFGQDAHFQGASRVFIDFPTGQESQPLDVSLPEVREYMKKALDTLCLEYGFEGVKHDFWSYAFEDSQRSLYSKEASGMNGATGG